MSDIDIRAIAREVQRLNEADMETAFVKTSGDTITGELNMGTNNITGVTSLYLATNSILTFGTAGSTSRISMALNVLFPVQAPTASAPAYVKGGLYFDTTLNKLRVGGATDWETVTSA